MIGRQGLSMSGMEYSIKDVVNYLKLYLLYFKNNFYSKKFKTTTKVI